MIAYIRIPTAPVLAYSNVHHKESDKHSKVYYKLMNTVYYGLHMNKRVQVI